MKEKHLYDVNLHCFHTAPHAILKNRMYLQKYLYLTNKTLLNTIIGLIMMHESKDLTLILNIKMLDIKSLT